MTQHAHVIHHIPGRMRVKLPRAKGNHRFLQQVQEFIAPLTGVKRVDINPVTGSVVVYYDPDVHEDFHSHLAEHAEGAELFALSLPELSEVDEIAMKIEREAEFLAGHSVTARSVVNFVKYLNESIKQATNNTVDLKVLLPLGLAIYSFLGDKEKTTPLWVTLGIFSFNSFVALHRPSPVVNVDVHDSPQQAQAAQRKSANSAPKKIRKRK